MIDSKEPKDGDFIRYVEDLVRMPRDAHLPGGASPGEVVRTGRAPGEPGSLIRTLRDLLEKRAGSLPEKRKAPATMLPSRSASEAAGHPDPLTATHAPHPGRPVGRPAPLEPGAPPVSPQARKRADRGDAAVVSRLLGRVASILVFAGVVLLAMSFADAPPVPIDPILGIAMLAGAAVLKRIAKGIA